MISDKMEYYKWLLDKTMTVANAPCVLGIPEIYLEDKKMRFKKGFVGTLSGEQLFRVVDSENKIPFGDVLADERIVGKTVDWLNENIKDEKEMSFDEAVEKAISELWNPDEIAYSNIDGEYVIHELKRTNIICPIISDKLPYAAEVSYNELDWGRNVFIIKEKKV